jgi:putative acetyltransferase
MIVRAMLPGDAEAIHAIHGLCLNRKLLGHYTSEQIEAWTTGRTPQGYLNAAESGERFLVAVSDAAVIGSGSWQDDEPLSLFVHPDFHGRGVGTTLMSSCLDDAAQAGATISIVKSVLGAEDFYGRFGFEIEGPGSIAKRDVTIPHILMRRI